MALSSSRHVYFYDHAEALADEFGKLLTFKRVPEK